MEQSPILVIGKNGKAGERVRERLQQLGYATRTVSRSSSPAFDWDDTDTWEAAIQGTRQAFVTYQPDLAVPDAEADIKHFIELARKHDLQQIVLLSGRGEEGAQRAEGILQQSGISWNVVRCGWFMQNFSESFMLEGILDGELILPESDTVEPFIDVDDIADVAVAALTGSLVADRVYEVTGPHSMSFAECIEQISIAVGRPIKYTAVPIDDYIEALRQQGMSEEMQWLLRELFTVVFDGRNSNVMPGVTEALKRPAGDFQHYLAKCIKSGIWKLPEQKSA